MILAANTLELLVANDELRRLLPCIALHPKDVVDRARARCGGCAGGARRKEAGRVRQLDTVVQHLARCLSESRDLDKVKGVLNDDTIIVYIGDQRLVL